MTKTVMISARIDPKLKNNAERIFRKLGLTNTEAISLFYKLVDLQDGLPFDIKIPNETTRKALENAKKRRNLESFDSAESLFKSLGI